MMQYVLVIHVGPKIEKVVGIFDSPASAHDWANRHVEAGKHWTVQTLDKT